MKFDISMTNFEYTDTFLEMMSKYELLQEHCPARLMDWDIDEECQCLRAVLGNNDSAKCNSFLDPASAIMLARKRNVTENLPAAFYCLSTVNPLHSWTNKLEDGTISVDFKDKRWMDLSTQTIFDRCARWGLGAREFMDLIVGR